jgi:uncharacterized membrane protein (UPF0127 family)
MKQKIIVGVLILVMIAFVLPGLMSGLKGFFSKDEGEKPKTTLPAISEPEFKHEGQLYILQERDTISVIDLEIADTPAERQRGMMYRTKLGEDQGMLFIFDRQQPQSFWMKNTYISLDMIFIDDKKNIVDIARNAVPYSEASVSSRYPAQYVLEMNGGYAARHNIRIGQRVNWSGI